MFKKISCRVFLLLACFSFTHAALADNPDYLQQQRASQAFDDLDAEFAEPKKAKPEVRVVEKIIVVEKIVSEPDHEHGDSHQRNIRPSDLIDDMVTDNSTLESVEEVDDYIFKLGNCRMSGRNIKCNISILNTERDSNLWMYATNGGYSSALFDRNGNEYKASKISIGNQSNNRMIKKEYIGGVTAKGSLQFKNIARTTQSIALIKLSVYDNNGYKFIKFRNVSLQH